MSMHFTPPPMTPIEILRIGAKHSAEGQFNREFSETDYLGAAFETIEARDQQWQEVVRKAVEESASNERETHGELDPRRASDYARQMLSYVQSFNGQKFGALDDVDRQNLGTALDNLQEAAAMLLNMADRVQASEPSAPMSNDNRLVAYSAAFTLRAIGYEWRSETKKWESVSSGSVLQPMDLNEFSEICHAAHIDFEMGNHPSYERSFEHHYLERLRLISTIAKPVEFLASGTRFKISFFNHEDERGNATGGTYVSCFEAFEKELDGRWVALVPAEDDCHRNLIAAPAKD